MHDDMAGESSAECLQIAACLIGALDTYNMDP